MKEVEIFTDGACKGNPGPGGWGAILIFNGIEKEISGGKSQTTNNEMELQAVVEAISLLKEPCSVKVTSDSNYVVKGANEWMEGWSIKGWKSTTGLVKNLELWKRLYDLKKIHKIELIWVKGHSGHPYNERCDKLAVAQRDIF